MPLPLAKSIGRFLKTPGRAIFGAGRDCQSRCVDESNIDSPRSLMGSLLHVSIAQAIKINRRSVTLGDKFAAC